ncbi:MAG TPA: YhjD/YihY/BrkB family envelope integrity protein [Thermoanaerobaculia bacterium]|nr:YhjD/YihY/BrkB family envelope integrity protein [Thermoanaerobaculia bacterium]
MVDAEGEGRPAAPAAPAGRPRRGRRSARAPRTPRIGRPPRPRGPRPAGPPATALQLLRFLGHMLRQAHADGIFLTASALAFVTMLSLVPLFAAFSFIGTRVFNQYQRRSLEVFVQVLPYSDETVVEKIRQFVDQAGTIHGFGILAFFATSLFAFATIEETFNKIWNVSRRRPLRNRLLSFVLLFFWGPLLLGATFTSLILLRQSPALRRLFEASVLLQVLPFVATTVGLTILYWVVPYTRVRLRNALIGGLFASIFLELLRQGFASYVEFFRNVNIVYGSFAFLLLFMISIELTWTIVLLGSEAAYTAQNFGVLAHGREPNLPLQASWVGLTALALIAGQKERGLPPLTHEGLAERVHLTPRELNRVINPLLSHKLLRTTAGGGSYLLGPEPADLAVERVFAAYDHRARRAVEPVGDAIQARMERLIADLAQTRGRQLGDLTLEELIASAVPTAEG